MRKNLYLFILLMIICSITTLATAQVTKVVIRGVVTAAIDKLPLPGAHVMLLNKDGRVVGNAIADIVCVWRHVQETILWFPIRV